MKLPIAICVGVLATCAAVSVILWLRHEGAPWSAGTNAYHEASLRESVKHARVRQGVFESVPTSGKTLDQVRLLCGVNCLYLVNEYYGIHCPYGDLQRLLAPSDLGVSLERLKVVAESLGYQAEAYTVSVESLCYVREPMIILARNDRNDPYGHFLVVGPGAEGQSFWLYDPPYRKREVRRAELARGDIKETAALFLRPTGQAKE